MTRPAISANDFNVLAITGLFPNACEPEKGVFNKQQFIALTAHAHVRVIAPVPWLPPLPMLRRWTRWQRFAAVPRHETIGGIEVSHPRYANLPKIGQQSYAAAFAAGIRPTVRRFLHAAHPHCVLATWAYPEIVAAVKLRSELKAPIVAKVHGTDINVEAATGWRRQVVADALRQCDAVVCVSVGLQERVLALGVEPDKVYLVGNGVDGERFTPLDQAQCRRGLGLALDGRLIVFIGNLVPVKGPDVLMPAFARLQSLGNVAPVRLAVVGDGRMRSALENQAAGPLAAGLVRFVGSRPHEEIATWLGAADVLCLPSRQEGSPNVVLEALASGRPVVASRTGGLQELIRPPVNGLLVPPENPNALAQALSDALQTEWNPHQIRQSASVSWEQSAARLFDVLRGATGRA